MRNAEKKEGEKIRRLEVGKVKAESSRLKVEGWRQKDGR
jgi:hypothetical protein